MKTNFMVLLKKNSGFRCEISPLPPLISKKSMWYVYILKCSNGNHYTGCTNNLEERMNRHNNGHVHSTKSVRPVELVMYSAFTNKYKAYEFEKYLKSGSGKAFRNKRLI